MEDQIAHFTEQFSWEPELLNTEHLPSSFSHTIVAGMGGSHLGARLLLRHDPTLPLSIHSDYGLPRESRERLEHALIVASSYSGETEEVLDTARAAVDAGFTVAVITTGGALADFAREHSLPLILLPKLAVEPRMAVGAQMIALARLMRLTKLELAIRETGKGLDTECGRVKAGVIAGSLPRVIPLIYASTLNLPIAYFWKIAFNETSKSPAAYNVFPELCHNELSGFDLTDTAHPVADYLHVIMIEDSDDHPRITKRIRIMREMLEARNIATTTVELAGATGLEKALYGILQGVWLALALAKEYKSPDAATPLIAEFKHKMIGI